MIRAVIDTNVLVSALISPLGNEALIVVAVREGLIIPCFSDEIVHEYAGVLARPKFSFPHDEISALIGLLRRHGELFDFPSDPTLALPDRGDVKFLGCAVAAEAVLLTGNRRHFPLKDCRGIEVVNAAELLDRMTLEK